MVQYESGNMWPSMHAQGGIYLNNVHVIVRVYAALAAGAESRPIFGWNHQVRGKSGRIQMSMSPDVSVSSALMLSCLFPGNRGVADREP